MLTQGRVAKTSDGGDNLACTSPSKDGSFRLAALLRFTLSSFCEYSHCGYSPV